jgi:exopolyphosphatase/guanosine-5'-triphosphate,3'-diphosphate pyrophosphatase
LTESKVVAFLDIGTNSVRLLLVRLNANLSYTVLTKQKEVVRLGEGEFIDQTLQPEAIQRTVQVCSQFAGLARSRQAEEIIAVATSATREANNQAEFVNRMKEEAGLDVHVVSGKEEARLIYRGVSSGIHLGTSTALFIDIGGGSTETIVGSQREYFDLDTHRLGAIRLTNTYFLPDESGPVDQVRYALIKNYVRNTIVRTVQRIKEYAIDLVIGSSGTITNLANVAFHYKHDREMERDDVVHLDELSDTIRMLCSLPLEKRRQVPGINPYRADIIIAGAAIIETILEELSLDTLRTSDRGLLDGLLEDYLERHDKENQLGELSIRERSVLQLGRSVNFDEIHARTVARLAGELFDEAREAGLHDLDRHARELLEDAALLHDSGGFISYPNHHAHSYYLIRNADLLGFDEEEIGIIANTAFFHRKNAPSKKYREFAALNPGDQQTVRILSMFLRLAEGLDRSHAGVVEHVHLVPESRTRLCLEIVSNQDCQLEILGTNIHREAFQKLFGISLEIIRKPVEAE